jgi:type I restriction enzyme S subunit
MSEMTTVFLGSLLAQPPEYGANASAQPPNGVDPRYLRITDIDEAGRLLYDDVRAIPQRVGEPYLLEQNDIVIARTGNTVGKSYIHDEHNGQIAFAGYLIRFRLDSEKVDARFVFQFLHSPDYYGWIDRTLRTGAQPNINATEYKQLPLPFLSLPEQRKIAKILTTVDNLIEKTEALIAKYEAIKQGMMHDLFTRGVDAHGHLRPPYDEAPELYKESELGWVPREWEVGVLGDEIGPIVSGWSPICDAVPAAHNEWGILKTTAVVWGGYDEAENKRLPDHLMPIESIEVQTDDILITRKGPVDRVGVVVHVYATRPRLMIPDTVFRVRLENESQLIPAFVPLALGCEQVQNDWFGRKIGLADAQVNVNHAILRRTVVPIPSHDEQLAIVDRIHSITQQVCDEQHHAQKLRKVKIGLMQDLLTCNVRVTVDDPQETLA